MDTLDTVYVATPGTSLHLDGEAIRVVHRDRPGRHLIPLLRVESLVLWRGVDVSTDLLRRCAASGIHVTWMTQNGRLCASITGHEPGRPDLRLAQFRAHEDPERRLAIARLIVAAKVQNYRQLLLRAGRDAVGDRQRRIRGVAELHAACLPRLAAASSLTEMLGLEGQAARAYFNGLDDLAADAATIRTRRPPLDPFNCYLSAAYGLLRSSVHTALVHVGFDPFVGYIHGIRANQPSLALDLMEEMRALLVDRMVLTLFNRGQVMDSYLRTAEGGAVLLTDDGWKHLLTAWVQARQRAWPHAGQGHEVTAAELPLVQARALARHLREPDWPYRPWTVA